MNTFMPLKNPSIKSLAIGCFDGFHLAHLRLLSKLEDPASILIINKGQKSLLSPVREELTPLPIYYLNLSDIKDMDGKSFLALLKLSFPSLRKIVVGYDFAFGKDRACKAEDIKKLSDFDLYILKEFKKDGISVHTRFIKELLLKARLKKANSLLGRKYSIKASIIKGQGLGSKDFVPTLNLNPSSYFLPKEGVYATLSEFDGKAFISASFIGKRSTDESFSVETHIIKNTDFSLPTTLKLTFLAYIRENIIFNDKKSLKAQILKDIEKIKKRYKDAR